MVKRSCIRVILTLLALGLLALGAGCSGPASVVERGPQTQELHLGNGNEPSALDPHVATSVAANNIFFALFEGLLRFDAQTLEPRPGVAASWTVSDNGRTWRFTLDPRARWSNGDAVTAGDFVFAWQRLLTPAVGAPYANFLYVITGAEAYHRGETHDFAEVGVRALQDDLLEVRLTRAVPWFPALLAHPVTSPLHAATLNAHEGALTRGNAWTQADTMVSNGPFRLTSWNVNDVIVVRSNPHYRAHEAVALTAIHFHAIADQHAEERAFRAGQLHATSALAPLTARKLAEDGEASLRREPYAGTEYILFNTREAPLADPRVRQALALAVDRAALTDHVLGAGERPAHSLVPPGLTTYTPPVAHAYAPQTARALLAAAGYAGGEGFPELTWLHTPAPRTRQLAEALQAQWRSTLGIRVELVGREWQSYQQDRVNGAFTLARASWIADFVDPYSFLGVWETSSANNYSGWHDADYDSLLAAANASESPTLRHTLLHEAETLLLEATPMSPLFHYARAWLLHPSVRGWETNPLGWPDYTRLTLVALE